MWQLLHRRKNTEYKAKILWGEGERKEGEWEEKEAGERESKQLSRKKNDNINT